MKINGTIFLDKLVNCHWIFKFSYTSFNWHYAKFCCYCCCLFVLTCFEFNCTLPRLKKRLNSKLRLSQLFSFWFRRFDVSFLVLHLANVCFCKMHFVKFCEFSLRKISEWLLIGRLKSTEVLNFKKCIKDFFSTIWKFIIYLV